MSYEDGNGGYWIYDGKGNATSYVPEVTPPPANQGVSTIVVVVGNSAASVDAATQVPAQAAYDANAGVTTPPTYVAYSGGKSQPAYVPYSGGKSQQSNSQASQVSQAQAQYQVPNYADNSAATVVSVIQQPAVGQNYSDGITTNVESSPQNPILNRVSGGPGAL